MMNKTFKFFLFVVLAMTAAPILAQEVETVKLESSVEDGFLHRALPQATITLLGADSSTVVQDSISVLQFMNTNGTCMMAAIYVKVPREPRVYMLRAVLDGYTTAWQRVEVTSKSGSTIQVPALQLRRAPKQVTIDGAVVKATRIKMYHRGDTVVYDASAFQLPDGSMLDDLIKELPGVTMNDQGEIFSNGRKVDELLLGSRSFMGGNKKVLLENLPYYTVKTIKLYDKTSDVSEALGRDMGDKKFVMDVNLKPEYQTGYIGNAEVAGGTEERFLGRAFLLGFTNKLRFTLLGNANNVNEERHIGESNHWTPASMPRSLQTTRSLATDLSYEGGQGKKKVKDAFYAEYTSTSALQQTTTRREQFLQGAAPMTYSEATNHSGGWRTKMTNRLTLKTPYFWKLNTSYEYAKHDGHAEHLQEQSDRDMLTTAMRTSNMDGGRSVRADVSTDGAFNVTNNAIVNYKAAVQYQSDQTNSASRYLTEQFVTPALTTQHNARSAHNCSTHSVLEVAFNRYFKNNVHFSIGNDLAFDNRFRHDYLYHPDTLLLASQLDQLQAITDPSNSYDSHERRFSNTLAFYLSQVGFYEWSPTTPMTLTYSKWNIQVKLPYISERLAYQRGSLDTVATRSKVYLNASGSYHLLLDKYNRRSFELSGGTQLRSSELNNRISYRDDSNPLVVSLGNPKLKDIATSYVRVGYYDKKGKHNQQLHFDSQLDYVHRNVAQSVIYDAATGIYTYKPQNVCGAYNIQMSGGISRFFDQKERWRGQLNAGHGWNHAVDHAMLSGDTESRVNTVNSTKSNIGVNLKFDNKVVNITALSTMSYRHSTGRMRDFQKLNATDFKYGIIARYTTPKLKTTLSADATMYCRRGYGNANLNTDDFIVNVSISQPLIKSKLLVRLEAFDLFHQLSNTQYEVTAQGRTETSFRSLPHYVMLHMVYHWNKNPHKR